MKLIDKDAAVAEIKRRLSLISQNTNAYEEGRKRTYIAVLYLIDTLEVKEVDEWKERMSECPYRRVGCAMYEGKILECKGACSWVVDYPKLKELKAQKNEG